MIFLRAGEEKSEESKINQLDGIVECCGHLRHTLLTSSLSLLAYTTASSSVKDDVLFSLCMVKKKMAKLLTFSKCCVADFILFFSAPILRVTF